MLTNSQPIRVATFTSFGQGASHNPAHGGGASRSGPAYSEGRLLGRRSAQFTDVSSPTVNVAPCRVITRRGREWRGMGAEFVQTTSHDRVDYSFHSSRHLLAAYEQGVRRDGARPISLASRRSAVKMYAVQPAYFFLRASPILG